MKKIDEGVNDTQKVVSKVENDETQKVTKLPLEVFPEEVQKMIKECVDVYGTHQDLWISALLAVSGSAIGTSVCLETKYKNYPMFWILNVAPSGYGKTQPIKIFYRALHEKDKESHEEYKSEQKVVFGLGDQSSSNESKQDKTPPKIQQSIVTDITPEAMGIALESSKQGITLLRDELLGFFLDLNRYNVNGQIQSLLSVFSGEPFKIARVKRDPIFVLEPFISIVGGTQTELLSRVGTHELQVNGFMARMLFVLPEIKQFPVYSDKTISDEIINGITNLVISLTSNELYPVLTLSNGAKKVYERFYNKNKKLNSSALYPALMKRANAKLDIHVLRIAIVLHVLEQKFSEDKNASISEKTMINAVKFAEYFRYTANKVNDLLAKKGSDIKDLILGLAAKGVPQRKIASILKVTQPYVSKIVNSNSCQ